MEKQTGTVISIIGERGFGFIQTPDGQEVFFPARAVCDPTFEELREGHRVEFMVVPAKKGPKAIGIRLAEPMPLRAMQGW